MTKIQDIAGLAHEPLTSKRNEDLLVEISKIERTSQFSEMNLTDEELDSILEGLDSQENFVGNIDQFIVNLHDMPSIQIEEDEEEDDYL
jgi:hypothetical protein